MECAGHLLISFVCLVVGRGRGQGKWASRDISCPCFADENQFTAKKKNSRLATRYYYDHFENLISHGF